MRTFRTYYRPRVTVLLRDVEKASTEILGHLREGRIVDITAPASRYPWRDEGRKININFNRAGELEPGTRAGTMTGTRASS